MVCMPAIPESAKISLQQRLWERAEQNWPQLIGVNVRFRAQFAYVDGELRDGERLPLLRLRYGGSAHRCGLGDLRGQQREVSGPDLVHWRGRGRFRPRL
jgi:hypothetical protein